MTEPRCLVPSLRRGAVATMRQLKIFFHRFLERFHTGYDASTGLLVCGHPPGSSRPEKHITTPKESR